MSDANLDKLRVLLIEDNRADAVLFERYLKKSKDGRRYEVFTAQTLAQGLAALQHQTFDMIVADLSLPDSSGLNTVEEIRKYHPLITLVVLTGLKDEEVGLGAVQCGAQDYLTKGSFDKNKLSQSLRFAYERQRNLSAAQVQKSMGDGADRDQLTDLPNRKMFRDRLTHAVSMAARSKRILSVMYLDLDGFKEVNDAFGTKVGDLLLRSVVQRLQETLRGSDSLGRIGGDEFSILIDDLNSTDDVRIIAKKVMKIFHEPFPIDSYKLLLRGSIGISIFPDDAATADELIQQADTALCQAKKLGRNQFRFFSPRLTAQDRALSEQEKALSKAIENKEFYVNYEPQFDLKTHRQVGVRASLEWRSPDWGVVPASRYAALGSSSLVLKKMDQFLLAEVCQKLKSWRDRGLNLQASLDLFCMRTLKHDFIRDMTATFKQYGIPTESIFLDISEKDLVKRSDRVSSFMKVVLQSGIRLVLKDFGGGLVPIAEIKSLPLAAVRIDAANLSADAKTETGVLKAMVETVHLFGFRSIVEGIDSDEKISLYKGLGCQIGQGLALSSPSDPVVAINS